MFEFGWIIQSNKVTLKIFVSFMINTIQSYQSVIWFAYFGKGTFKVFNVKFIVSSLKLFPTWNLKLKVFNKDNFACLFRRFKFNIVESIDNLFCCF